MRKLFSLTRKIVPVTENMLFIHIAWVLIARGRTHHLPGSTPCVTYFLWQSKMKNIPVTENILHVMHTVRLVKGGKFPVTWWNISNIHVTRKTSCDRKNTSCDKRSIILISVTEYFFPVKERILYVTGIKKNTLCHNTIFLRIKE